MSLPLPPAVLDRLSTVLGTATLRDGLIEVTDTRMLPPTAGGDKPGTEISYRWQGKMTTAMTGGFREFPVGRNDRLYVLLSDDVPILFLHVLSGVFSFPPGDEAERLREEFLEAVDPLDIETVIKRFAADTSGPARVEQSRAWHEFSGGMVEVELTAEQKKRKKKRRFRIGALVGGVAMIALVVAFFQVQTSGGGGPGGGALGPGGGGGILGAILGPSKTDPTEFVDQVQFTLEETRAGGTAALPRCEFVGHVHNRMARTLDKLEFVARVRDQDIAFRVVGYGKGQEQRGVLFAGHDGACLPSYKARYEVTDKVCDINGLPWKGGCRDFVRILF